MSDAAESKAANADSMDVDDSLPRRQKNQVKGFIKRTSRPAGQLISKKRAPSKPKRSKSKSSLFRVHKY